MLYLLRHAKATPASDNDFERPLTPQGRKDAQRIGLWLKQRIHLPDLIMTSSATRAMETAEIVAQAIGYEANMISGLKSLYEADQDQILELIQSVSPSVKSLLLIGHNPSLEALVQTLFNPASSRVQLAELHPASLAMLGEITDWQSLKPASATLLGLIHGKYLPKAL